MSANGKQCPTPDTYGKSCGGLRQRVASPLLRGKAVIRTGSPTKIAVKQLVQDVSAQGARLHARNE
ncbi:MAG: hypothetical protein KME30_02290 [Iphinoe sp. HA4291-MV1]|nr:hypothetical protein [Iphinoe sp. HA4291-MV1]